MAITGVPIPSGLDYKTQMFPILTAAQIERIRPWAKPRPAHAGEVLFQPGDESVPFFVLLSGSLEILQPGPMRETLVVTHTAGDLPAKSQPCRAAGLHAGPGGERR